MDPKIGSVVVLKSGGPKMTLGNKMMGSDYKCQWFDGKVMKEALFPIDSIEEYKEPPVSSQEFRV